MSDATERRPGSDDVHAEPQPYPAHPSRMRQRPGQPAGSAPAYVPLASSEASYVTGALCEVASDRLSPGWMAPSLGTPGEG